MLVSNVPGAAEALLNALPDASGIMAKETEADTEKLSDSIRKAITSGSYDLCITIPKDHLKASIMLNRDKGINAAICLLPEDLDLAKANSANVIIIKAGEEERAAKMLKSILEGAVSRINSQNEEAKYEKQEKQRELRQEPRSESQKEPSEDEEPKRQHKVLIGENTQVKDNGSFFKKIKSSLGIED
jgi:ribose 5-phosphate isomerase RpiB